MATKTTKKAAVEEHAAENVTDAMTEDVKPERKHEDKVVPKEIDPDMYVTVRNGFRGKLFYKSSKTGEKFRWQNYGDEQEMELRELKNAKNSNKKFFENNWFMFNDLWVLDYLGVRQFYKNALKIEDYDKLFDKTPAEMKRIIGEMTPSQKRSASYRATELIRDGKIDSLKRIAAIEEALGIELIEK